MAALGWAVYRYDDSVCRVEAPPPVKYRSPVTGRPLTPDTPWSLSDGLGGRWPVIDGIVYLRTGRDKLVREVVRHLDEERAEEALVLLLADTDDWWAGGPRDPERLRALVRGRDQLSFRDAMDHLGFERRGLYFAHRWSDPTFLAGLALLEAHWNRPETAFELACGAGHYLRELSRHGVRATGSDLIFAKLWLARHWVAGPDVELLCFDAAAPWPVTDRFDLVLCQDALTFLEPKASILAAMRALAGSGWLAVSHLHNVEWPNLSSGQAVTAACVEALFPNGVVYDDAELTRALAEARAPQPAEPRDLTGVQAFSVACGPTLVRAPRPVGGGLTLPPEGARLRRNPLYQGGRISWPSERYAAQYGPRAIFPEFSDAPEHAVFDAALADRARRREMVDLPERW
jgi:hypothetical protein